MAHILQDRPTHNRPTHILEQADKRPAIMLTSKQTSKKPTRTTSEQVVSDIDKENNGAKQRRSKRKDKKALPTGVVAFSGVSCPDELAKVR